MKVQLKLFKGMPIFMFIKSDFIMGQYTSYYLYTKYEIIGGELIDTGIKSIDADGTMPVVVKSSSDTACGYQPDKQYRTISGDPYCNGYDKYINVLYQESTDGTSWITTATTPTLVEHNSEDCGYVHFDGKLYITYSDSTVYSAECDSSSAITSADTHPSGYDYSAITSVVIGDCATSIEQYAFDKCSGLTSVIIPDNITSIGNYAFYVCRGLSSVTMGSGVTTIGAAALFECSSLKRLNSSVDGVFNIPNSVTSIGQSAFSHCSGLTSCTIGSGITIIDDGLFGNCGNLSVINIPNTVTTIGYGAFGYCRSLTSITIPNSVTTIGNNAFSECNNLVNINIPSGVTSIGEYTFYYCDSLSSIDIHDNITSIGNYAFYVCRGLSSVTIPDSVTTIGNNAFGYCSGLTSCTIGSGITSIDYMAFYNCPNLTSATLFATTPPSVGWGIFNNTNENLIIYVPCESVDEYKQASGWSDYSSRIQGIEPCGGEYRWQPSGTTCVGVNKYNQVIKQVSYDSGTTWQNVIPEEYSATTLIEVNSTDCGYVPPLPAGTKFRFTYTGGTVYTAECDSSSAVTSADTRGPQVLPTYHITAMTSAEIGDCVTSIGREGDSLEAFKWADSLTSVTLGNNIETISKGSFYGCSGLTSITIPNSVTSIGFAAFNLCSGMTNAVIGSGAIGNDVFGNCSALSALTIGNGVTSIGEGAFYYCSGLTSIIIPDSVTSIGEGAFYYCSGLTSVEIGSGVTSIDYGAFSRCRSLTSATLFATTPPTLGNNAFSYTNENLIIYVPSGSVNAYKSASGWSDYSSRIQAIP